ncbi:MAG: N-acetyltransferase family protein [Gammaproteobacteria bacterium]
MQIGLVSPAQHDSLVTLLCELYAYYNPTPIEPALVREHLQQRLLARDSPLQLVVAVEHGTVLGFAAFALLYSLVDPTPGQRRQCMMKELYVRDACRGRGVGRALMAWIARHALEEGCCRVDWNVQASNPRGIAFYESLGAARVGDRLSYRLGRAAMDALSSSGS